MPCEQTFTYQARMQMDALGCRLMIEMAKLFSSIERCLFKDLAAGKKASALKSEYLQKYQITARHFNAIRIQLEGKIASAKERQIALASQLNEKITSITKRLPKLKDPHKIHQKKRLLSRLTERLQKVQADIKAKKLSICFGSKRLYNQQFHLEENGFETHEQWLEKWQFTRNNSFFLVGSKDESQGNQSCTATVDEKGAFTLRIRLPQPKGRQGKYLLIPDVYFAYGQENIIQALKEGSAISYRFKCDEKGWRVFVSLCLSPPPVTTSAAQGVIGVDINIDHLAIAESDRFGNPIARKSFVLNTYGKDRNQAKALIGDVCSSLVALAKKTGKTLVIEKLDFAKKKAALKEERSPKQSRMLSSFAYNSIKSHLKAKGYREGVEVEEVNPAFTSLIGRMKFARRYGLSIHQAAALVIGRRFLQVSERVPRSLEKIPDGRGGHVALPLPVRNRGKHVWSSWRALHRKLQTVLAAHFRTKRSSSSKSTCETKPIPKFTGEIPVRESAGTTARPACLDRSTLVFV